MDYYNNGGTYMGVWIEPKDPRFLSAHVLLLDSEVTYEDRLHIVLLKFEQEENGVKLAKCWDFMTVFGKQLKNLSYAEIEAAYKHVNPTKYNKTRIAEYREAYNIYASIPGGLDALRQYTKFVETDRGLQGIMNLGVLYNNRELDLCPADVKQQVIQLIRETCDEQNFVAQPNSKFKWAPAAVSSWRIVNSGPALSEAIFRLRMRALCRAQVTEVMLNGKHDTVCLSTFL
jgi:hypothetical protein